MQCGTVHRGIVGSLFRWRWRTLELAFLMHRHHMRPHFWEPVANFVLRATAYQLPPPMFTLEVSSFGRPFLRISIHRQLHLFYSVAITGGVCYKRGSKWLQPDWGVASPSVSSTNTGFQRFLHVPAISCSLTRWASVSQADEWGHNWQEWSWLLCP